MLKGMLSLCDSGRYLRGASFHRPAFSFLSRFEVPDWGKKMDEEQITTINQAPLAFTDHSTAC